MKSNGALGQSPPRAPEAAIARPGKGIIEGIDPTPDPDEAEDESEEETEDENGDGNADARGGMAGVMGVGDAGLALGTWGPVLTSVTRESMRRVPNFHSPHQSSSRTWGQTPSIMYDLALIGCSIGEPRRHCPHCVTLPSLGLAFCRS